MGTAGLEDGQTQVQAPSPVTQWQKQDWPLGIRQHLRSEGWHVPREMGKGSDVCPSKRAECKLQTTAGTQGGLTAS